MNKFESKVYLVGAGPGDPGLITQKGLELLGQCDLVIYDRLVSEELLSYVKDGCEKIYVGKTPGNHTMLQEEINQLLIQKASIYPIIVRLKGGDPFVFGRGGEEVLALKQHGIAYEVIPGVTSAIAAATYAGIPITHRGSSQSFHVITGHTAEQSDLLPEDFKVLSQIQGTIVILMGLSNFEKIRENLLTYGKPATTPIAVIENGTTKEQKEVRGTLDNICDKVKEANIKAPAVIIIGNVAELDMKTTINYPLTGVSVGITGTKAMTDKLTLQLEALGAEVRTISALEIIENEKSLELEKALLAIETYQWVIFTSSNAVKLFFQKLRKLAIDQRRLAHIRFAIIGTGTEQTLAEYGYHADLIPDQYTTFHLANKICSFVKEEDNILIPRASQGSDDLIEILKQNGMKYDDIKFYDVKASDQEDKDISEKLKGIDYLTFASASGVHALLEKCNINPRDLLGDIKVVCIGDATNEALRHYCYMDAIIAKEASAPGLVECIVNHYVK